MQTTRNNEDTSTFATHDFLLSLDGRFDSHDDDDDRSLENFYKMLLHADLNGCSSIGRNIWHSNDAELIGTFSLHSVLDQW